jgi:trigger factor
MDIQITERDYCQLQIKCEADAELVAAKKEQVALKFKDQKVSGFRQGKAPLNAVKMHYKKQIAETLKQELAEEAFNDAISKNNLKPFGNPQFTVANIDDSKFICEFSLNTQPSFELKEYKNFNIPKPADPISSEEFAQKMIQDLRVRFGTTEPYTDNDFVQLGDSIVIDYEGSLDGVQLDVLKANGEVVVVGRTPLENFDSSLLGMSVNEEREFVINIPEASGMPELAGKPVTFKVKLIAGSKSLPAPIDDELAKKAGIDTVDQLMAEVTSMASSRINEIRNTAIYNQISRRLVDNHDFKVPSWIATAEAQIKARGQKQNWEELSDDDKEKLVKSAEDSVKLSLILEKVRGEEPEAQLTDEETFSAVRESFSKTSNKEQMLQTIISNGQLPLLMNHIRDEYTLGFIKKNSTIIE